MRLLNTSTKRLEEVPESVPYAILSHRWENEEVQFKDIHAPHVVTMAGYFKIERCCAQAFKDGYDYIWVDSCCIDKSSSAELSEAINSMYQLYRRAEVCYAYLSDVKSDQDPDRDDSSFSRSVWFTRGWTLQELVAPSIVIFFSGDWTEIGTKSSLVDRISRITRIGRDVLLLCYPGEASIAKRMSWAAGRTTTREEDRAYSLLGLFGISMPAVYGEGKNAFIRLQLEIMKTSSDQSIFTWHSSQQQQASAQASSGLLAPSPDEFISCYDVDRINSTSYMQNFVRHFSNVLPNPDYSTTNHGIHITLPLCPRNDDTYIAALCCNRGADTPPLCVFLRKTPNQTNQCIRVNTSVIGEAYIDDVNKFELHDVFVQEEDPSLFRLLDTRRGIPTSFNIRVRMVNVKEHGFILVDRAPTEFWTKTGDDFELHINPGGGFANLLFRHAGTGETFAVVLGVHNWRIWSWIYVPQLPEEEVSTWIQAIFSYSGSASRRELADLRWQALDSTSRDLANELKVRASMRKGGRYAPEGDGGYYATITVGPRGNTASEKHVEQTAEDRPVGEGPVEAVHVEDGHDTKPKRPWWRRFGHS